MKMELFADLLDFRIYHKDVALIVNKNIARNDVPHFILAIGEATHGSCLLEPQCCHIGVNHNLSGRTSIGYAWLHNDGLYGATIKTCKRMKRIGCVGENEIVHQHFSEQFNNAAAVQKIVHFVNDMVSHIGVVLVSTGTRYAQTENICHRKPIAIRFRHCFSGPVFHLKMTYILLAISRLRFMYSAKSFELIGNCCNAAIFRFLRSVTSLWNWLRNVIIHVVIERFILSVWENGTNLLNTKYYRNQLLTFE